MRIRFYGNKDYGYSAHRGMSSVEVKRGGKHWTSSYSGSPYLHNPIVRIEDGLTRMSAECPKIVVGSDFCTRREAAEAALTAAQKEDTLWRKACDDARAQLGGKTPGLKRCRKIFAELVSEATSG